MRLTDEEVLKLTEVVVENTRIKKINWEVGTRGAGNSNTSSYSSDVKREIFADKIKGKSIEFEDPFERYGCNTETMVGIAAVMDDVIYLILKSKYSGEMKVNCLEQGKTLRLSTEVAYDTFGIFKLSAEI